MGKKQNIALNTLQGTFGGIQTLSGLSLLHPGLEWDHGENLSKVTFFSGLANDVTNLTSEFLSKKYSLKQKIADTVVTATHYSTLLTQFYTNFPYIMLARSIAQTGYAGYKSFLIHKKHDYGAISSIASDLSNVAFNYSMVRRTNYGRFGHNYYGYGTQTAPPLRALHDDLRRIEPDTADQLVLGYENQYNHYFAHRYGHFYPYGKVQSISLQTWMGPKTTFSVGLHEFAHAIDSNFNYPHGLNYFHEADSNEMYHSRVHDKYFGVVNKIVTLKAYGHGLIDQSHADRLNEMDVDNHLILDDDHSGVFLHSLLDKAYAEYKTLTNPLHSLQKLQDDLRGIPAFLQAGRNPVTEYQKDYGFKTFLQNYPIPTRDPNNPTDFNVPEFLK